MRSHSEKINWAIRFARCQLEKLSVPSVTLLAWCHSPVEGLS